MIETIKLTENAEKQGNKMAFLRGFKPQTFGSGVPDLPPFTIPPLK